ncbi:MAG TPA: hypothetical protein VF630_19370 [Hymenobacter sp.]|jgi:hypothetical protein
MNTTPHPTRPALQADPKIVKKTRRNTAAYGSFSGRLGEAGHDYLHQPNPSFQAPRPLEFGRPGL